MELLSPFKLPCTWVTLFFSSPTINGLNKLLKKCAKKTTSQDYGTLLLGLLLVLSVYRLPSVLRDLQRHQGDFVHRARMVLTCQALLSAVRVRNFCRKKFSSKDPLKMNMRQKSPRRDVQPRVGPKTDLPPKKSKKPDGNHGRVKRSEKKEAGHFFLESFDSWFSWSKNHRKNVGTLGMAP